MDLVPPYAPTTRVSNAAVAAGRRGRSARVDKGSLFSGASPSDGGRGADVGPGGGRAEQTTEGPDRLGGDGCHGTNDDLDSGR